MTASRRSLPMVDRGSLAQPLFESRKAELETCAYCPKLCRAACPVSDAEWSESVTPWGKMSSVYVAARHAAVPDGASAELPWACTGCLACRERCDHRNPVRDTLFEARAAYVEAGAAPAGSERVRLRFGARIEATTQRQRELLNSELSGASSAEQPDVDLLLGCAYVNHAPEAVRAALRAARNLFGRVRVIEGCCGAPLDAAGAPEAARATREKLLGSLSPGARRIALDAGCTYSLRQDGFVPFSRTALDALATWASFPSFRGERLRYHDSCSLGRGLGEYEAPRALLRRALGGEPLEFPRRREFAACSGGGGLLPLTRPETARAIAKDRVLEHERSGGGKIVTACAQSLRSLKQAGADVIDLSEIIRSLSER
ncbi:MAG TPA: (Fe-S)-binding protein [Polyangiaceae bacterium]|nr:(Fe-S)-binding protein [Polyangiaceae bacterium]